MTRHPAITHRIATTVASLSATIFLMTTGSGPANAQSVGQWSAGNDAYNACMQGPPTPGKSEYCRYIQCLKEMTYLPNGQIDPAAAGQASAACRPLLEAFIQRNAPSQSVPDTTAPINTGYIPNGSPTGLYGGPGVVPMGWVKNAPGTGPFGRGNPPRGPRGKLPKPGMLPGPQSNNPPGSMPSGCHARPGGGIHCPKGNDPEAKLAKSASANNRALFQRNLRSTRLQSMRNAARVQRSPLARIPRFANQRFARTASMRQRMHAPRFASRGNFARVGFARGGRRR